MVVEILGCNGLMGGLMGPGHLLLRNSAASDGSSDILNKVAEILRLEGHHDKAPLPEGDAN